MKKNLALIIIVSLTLFVAGLHSCLFFLNKKTVATGESPSAPPQQMMSMQAGPRSIHMIAEGITYLQSDKYMPLDEAQKRVIVKELVRREELRKELKKCLELLKGALTEEQAQYITRIQYDPGASRFTPDPSSTAGIERQAVQKTIETLKKMDNP